MFLSNGAAISPQVDTLADRTPLFADANYYGSSNIGLLGLQASYGAMYKYQLWVGILVRKLASSTARMPFEVRIQLDDMDSVFENGPLSALLARPNQRMSGFRLWQWTASTRKIYGEAFWLKLRDQNGVVRELHPMHPVNVIVRRSADGGLEYIYSNGTAQTSELPPIPEADVVAFSAYNPENLARGLSNLEGLRQTLFNEDAARRASAAMWQNGARPSMVLTSKDTLSEGAQGRIKKLYSSTYSGADNTGKVAVFEEGITPTIIQLNNEEMQYVESRKLNREEVCAAFDVSPTVVHILDHATFSNVTEQLRSQYRDTMAPDFVDYESVVNHQLVPDFYPTTGDTLAYTRFNMDDVLRGDFETRAKAVTTLRQNGLATGNEGRSMFGLPRSEDPNMDKLFANAALVELGAPKQAIAITAAEPPDPSQEADVTAAEDAAGAPPAKAVTLRSVMGKFARTKDTRTQIRAKAVDVHADELGKFFDRQRASAKAAAGSKASGVFTGSDWDGELGDLLHTLSSATAKAIGAKVAKDLGGTYDGSDIAGYLEDNSAATAKKINATTEAEIIAALEKSASDDDGEDDDDTIDGVFDGEVTARTNQISLSRVAMVAGLAALVAARQSGVKTKTWTTGSNPRADHAEMDGETVPLGETFSNGMDGPGDYSGGVDEVAGCNCDLEFSTEG